MFDETAAYHNAQYLPYLDVPYHKSRYTGINANPQPLPEKNTPSYT